MTEGNATGRPVSRPATKDDLAVISATGSALAGLDALLMRPIPDWLRIELTKERQRGVKVFNEAIKELSAPEWQ